MRRSTSIRQLGARVPHGRSAGASTSPWPICASSHDAVFVAIGAQRAAGAALRGRGTRASPASSFWNWWPRQSAGARRRRRGGGRRQHRHGLRPLRRPAGRAERAHPLPPQPAGDALPDGGSGGRRSRRRAASSFWWRRCAWKRNGQRPAADLPAHGAGRAGRFGPAPAGGGGRLRFHHRVLHGDRRHRPGGGAMRWPSAKGCASPAGASPPTSARWPRICPASSPAATRCWEPTWRCGRWPREESPRPPSISTCRGEPVTGEPAVAGIAMRPVDDAERAAIFRAIEKAARVPCRRSRWSGARELRRSGAACRTDALREARRCLTCGCRKADCCLRPLAGHRVRRGRRTASPARAAVSRRTSPIPR